MGYLWYPPAAMGIILILLAFLELVMTVVIKIHLLFKKKFVGKDIQVAEAWNLVRMFFLQKKTTMAQHGAARKPQALRQGFTTL